jgi:hypothetical protein
MPQAAGCVAQAKKNLHYIVTELPSASAQRDTRQEFTLFLTL